MNTPRRSLETLLLDQRFITRLTTIILTISVLSIVGHIVFVDVFPHFSTTLQHQIDLNAEAAWSSWYNTLVDTLAGAAAFLVAWVTYTRSQGGQRSHVIAWIIIGCVFTYIGFDDNSQIHETMGVAIRNLIVQLNITQPFIYKYRANMWILVLGVPGMVVVLYMLWFFRKNHILRHKRVRAFILVGAFLYLTYAGTEAVKNLAVREANIEQFSTDVLRDNHPKEWTIFQVFVIVQESSELIGATLWMAGFLYYGAERLKQYHLVRSSTSQALEKPQVERLDELIGIRA